MTTFTTQDRIDAEEPIPFMGWVLLDNKEDKEQMLRDQIRMQQNEISRLNQLLLTNGISI